MPRRNASRFISSRSAGRLSRSSASNGSAPSGSRPASDEAAHHDDVGEDRRAQLEGDVRGVDDPGALERSFSVAAISSIVGYSAPPLLTACGKTGREFVMTATSGLPYWAMHPQRLQRLQTDDHVRLPLADERAVLHLSRDAQMAHDRAAALRGAVGLADGRVEAGADEHPADELRQEHVPLSADAGDDYVKRVFLAHLRPSP